MNNGVTTKDEDNIIRKYNSTPNHQGAVVSGYVRTQNSFAINEILYDPNNAGKTITQMFKRKVDRDTVKTLDKVISRNATPADASYTRFSSPNAIQATFGLTAKDMSILKNAKKLTPSELSLLSQKFEGTISHSKSYTSTSANRTLNAFSNPKATQSKGFIFERKISVPKGTKAYAPKMNAQESEVIFGRGMQTRVTGITVSSDGHIVIHEMFDGYY